MKDRKGFRKGIVGRGTSGNPKNRFEKIEVEPDLDEIGDDEPRPETVYLRDHSRSIIARNDSPDIGFEASINPYRGCSHGCSYCYARPTHEHLGLSAGLDFESRILVKEDAPELLREELSSPRWEPEVISMSGVTDPYQPVEKELRITRRCLEVLAEFRNPVAVVTKNHLVTRDIDFLSELAWHDAAVVTISLTTLDEDLRRIMEPRTSRPVRRLAAIEALAGAGVPVGVLTAPVIPGLTDHELPALISAAAGAGVRLRRLRSRAAAPRRPATLRRLAGAPLPGSQGESAQSHPFDAGRQAQRSPLRIAHEGRRDLRRLHSPDLLHKLSQDRHRRGALTEALDLRVPQERRDTARPLRLILRGVQPSSK